MVCRDFSVFGYCSKGAFCDQRHVHECPAWSNTGSCQNKRCRLPHVDRAGQIRRQTANHIDPFGKPVKDAPSNSDGSDLSSEGEEVNEIDSDDIDSEGLDDDILVNQSSANDLDAHRQDDFIHF